MVKVSVEKKHLVKKPSDVSLLREINCFSYTFIFIFLISDFKVLHVRETINKFTLFPDH